MEKLQVAPLILVVMISFIAHAQKLPNVQQASLYAPDNIKIDGKATEWDNKFQAYNHATELFYAIANDDNNLYLIIQAINENIINKIYRNGITFTINQSKKDNKERLSFTYPVFDKGERFSVNIKLKPVIVPGSVASIMKADSFMNANNKLMNNKSKYIMVTGAKGIDSLISIYNENGIKAAALFDNHMVYTLEMAIALKYLNLAEDSPVKLSYNLLLHPLKGGLDNVIRTIGPDGIPTVTRNTSEIPELLALASSTDFWGEYTLAKK